MKDLFEKYSNWIGLGLIILSLIGGTLLIMKKGTLAGESNKNSLMEEKNQKISELENKITDLEGQIEQLKSATPSAIHNRRLPHLRRHLWRLLQVKLPARLILILQLSFSLTRCQVLARSTPSG